jgi:hypothetical protein
MTAGFIPAYLPNIQYMARLVTEEKIAFINNKHYQKQTFRNRTEIYGANGKLKLTIPIVHHKTKAHQLDGKVAVHYDNKWQKDHWKSLEASYRSSPFFEYYEDDFYDFYHQKTNNLMDLNIEIIQKICVLIEADVTVIEEEVTHEKYSDLILAKKVSQPLYPTYHQVFHTKHGFINNLSVVDLLFNKGPQSLDYLLQLDK